MPQYPRNISPADAASLYGIKVGSPPVITNAPFSVLHTAAVGATVGTLVATNNPTTWGIVSGFPGIFAIDNTGKITVASAMVATVASPLGVFALNAFGKDQGIATITIT